MNPVKNRLNILKDNLIPYFARGRLHTCASQEKRKEVSPNL